MDDGWEEISSGGQLAELLDLGRLGSLPLERLLLAPDSGRFLRVEIDERSSAPGGFDMRVAGTRFFFNVSACKSFKGDVAVALTAYLATHSVPVATVAAALRKLADNLKLLTDDEVALVRAIIRSSSGNAYDEPVAVAAVRDCFEGDPDAVDDLLDSLQDKGVIDGRRRDRVKLVF
jgi:hypothetical protein